MEMCWNDHPKSRPAFDKLSLILEGLGSVTCDAKIEAPKRGKTG